LKSLFVSTQQISTMAFRFSSVFRHGPPKERNKIDNQDRDIEVGDPVNELVAGYPRLAGHMERLPEVAIFRRFGALNARTLCYQQAELAQLEKDLKTLEKEDALCGEKENLSFCDKKRGQYSKDWYYLKDSEDTEDRDARAAEQWRLAQKIMDRLRTYSKC
jgi:hypothetical protein